MNIPCVYVKHPVVLLEFFFKIFKHCMETYPTS